MMTIQQDDPLAVALLKAVYEGDVQSLQRLLAEHPGAASARIQDPKGARKLFHVAADWPGHFPRVALSLAA